MLTRLFLVVLACALWCGTASAQVKKLYTPAGQTLDKALQASLLIQPGAKPFHVKLQISQTKGAAGAYAATVDETWISDKQWTRTISAGSLTQTSVMNETGLHVATTGDYFPQWLRSFVTALFTPVPNAEEWNRSKEPLEHIELPGGARSNPCLHGEVMIGAGAVQQANFSNVCFRPDGLLDFVGSPSYAMEFHDYAGFGKLHVARTLIEHPVHGVELTGKVVALEPAQTSDPHVFSTPANAADKDALYEATVKQEQLERLAGGPIAFQWPNPVPGKGMFTVWVSVDRTGEVREAHPLNSDNSGLAADMSAQLVGRKWKAAVVDGQAAQVQGGMTFAYPVAAQ